MRIQRNSKWVSFDGTRTATVQRYDGHLVYYRIDEDDELMRVDAITFVRRYKLAVQTKEPPSDWTIS